MPEYRDSSLFLDTRIEADTESAPCGIAADQSPKIGVPDSCSESRLGQSSRRCAYFVTVAFLFILCLLPPARLIYILFTEGANCIGNDHVGWINLFDDLWRSRVSLLELPGRVYAGSHFRLFSLGAEFLFASLTDWNVRLECLTGIVLVSLNSLLQWDLLRYRLVGSDGSKVWSIPSLLLLLAVSAINFGVTQYSILLTGIWCLGSAGICHLGLTLSLWAIFRLRDSRPGLALSVMILAAIVASWSCGVAIPIAATLLFALIASGMRRKWHLGCWAIAVVLCVSPYVYFRLISGHLGAAAFSKFSISFFASILGRSLCNSIGTDFGEMLEAEVCVVVASVFLLIALFMALRRGRLSALYPAFAFVIYGAVCAALVASVRTTIAPWYAVHTKFFWVGVVGIAFSMLMWHRCSIGFKTQFDVAKVPGGKAPEVFVALIALSLWTTQYLRTNITYEDKHFYLTSRAPASESYQRNYLTAPTYGESLLFQWGPGNQNYARRLGSVLEEHRKGCFAEKQTWSLQGDFFLDRVNYERGRESTLPVWIRGSSPTDELPWHSFHPLNLCLLGAQSVTWKVEIPADARLASVTLTPVLLNRGLSPDTMTDSDDLELEDARLIRFEPAH